MAKSIRSKVKRSFRAKKREQGVYAATEAARLARLHQKLHGIASTDTDGDVPLEDAEGEEIHDEAARRDESQAETAMQPQGMEVDGAASPESTDSKRISTHGPRSSRREEWRKSKGLTVRAKSSKTNRQGLPVAKRRSGRSHRRR
ncbi:uncharacterized protein PHACADRAFT_250351 [Phanerochaete carnosa HHB-10118-sp]|uniref:DUF2423 domain-containing protein n=1 Tax=Phanerochaete carnosa (strain HHB-10118-sp) TaxID=650164 RepID=K5X9V3_PHACS|nr:uncharacterized protein PHACADRAFT_250351 [Phanerochaete carnosa HHB-10118-sp]EKM59692.1 hypothetical protein PHACADRAFT_250351 [Phanerochaete carnosa HHB-10118-sp]